MKKEIKILTRRERLEGLYHKVENIGRICQIISGGTLAIGGGSMIISKFIGLQLTPTQNYLLIGASVLLSIGFALFWEKGIRYLWRETSDQIIHWEFEHWPVMILFVVLLSCAGFMSYVSIMGSVYGSKDLAELTIVETSTPDLMATDSILGLQASSRLKNSQVTQSNQTDNYMMLYNQAARRWDDRIKQAKSRGKSNQTCCDNGDDTNAQCCKDAKWLMGGKIASLNKQKDKELRKLSDKHAPTLAGASMADSVYNKQLAINQDILSFLTEKSKAEVSKTVVRRKRHSQGFAFLAFIVTPLFVISIAIQSLIKKALNLQSTPLSILVSKPEPEKPVSRNQSKKTNGSSVITKTNTSPVKPKTQSNPAPQKTKTVSDPTVVDERYLKQRASQEWKRSYTRKDPRTRKACEDRAKKYIAALQKLGVEAMKDPNNEQKILFLKPQNGVQLEVTNDQNN